METKKHNIKYNDNSNNISNDLNEDELIIDNNNDEMNESFQLFGKKNILNNNNKKENKELKDKIKKTKVKIINIKNELNNKSDSNIKIDNKKNKNNKNENINNSINNNKNNIKNNKNNIIQNEKKYLYSNKSIELNEILSDKYLCNNNNYKNVLNNDNIKINKTYKNYNTISRFFSNSNKKDYINHIYNNQSKSNTMRYNKNEEIINKIKEINNKLNSKNTPKKRKTYTIFESKSKIQKSETIDNKHIKNNIPTYRRGYSKSNNIYASTLSFCTFDNKKTKRGPNLKKMTSLYNSLNKSLCSSNIKAHNNKKSYIFSNIYSFKKRKGTNSKNSKDNVSKYSIQQSYLNSSSIINKSTTDLNSKSAKNLKNHRLFNIILKNSIKCQTDNFSNNNQINTKDTDNDNDKNNIEQILLYQFRDVAEIDLSVLNIKESLIDNYILKTNINNKILMNYNKLDNFDNSQILYDGLIYKIIETKNKGFKIIERYFQIKKNCFRYYNNIENAKKDSDNPLVQFDIRHIKDLNIINNKIFQQFKINNKEIKFSFYILLNQNDDLFVFIVNDEKFGNCIFNFLNLLKNYYEDKK